MSRITWATKELWRISVLAAKYLWRAQDAEETKSSVNALYDLIDTDDVVFASSVDDFPAAVAGVRTLSKLYVLTASIDFEGDRLTGSGGLVGFSADKVRLTSTGLTGQPFITWTGNAIMHNLTIENVEKGFYINTAGTAFDWTRVNFENCTQSGEVGNCLFFIIDTMAFINSPNLVFSGTINSFVASPNCIWRSLAADILESQIKFESTFVATSRVRIQDTQINTLAGQTGIEFVSGATVPTDSFILRYVRFSTVGTPLNGINGDDLIADFIGCQGLDVINTEPNAYITMNENLTTTVISGLGVPTKILGTTTQQEPTQKFLCENNKITYLGAAPIFVKIQTIVSLSSGNNHQIGLYIAKNGTVLDQSETYETTDGTGRKNNMVVQTKTRLNNLDYIENFVENNTSPSTNILVNSLSTIVD